MQNDLDFIILSLLADFGFYLSSEKFDLSDDELEKVETLFLELFFVVLSGWHIIF